MIIPATSVLHVAEAALPVLVPGGRTILQREGEVHIDFASLLTEQEPPENAGNTPREEGTGIPSDLEEESASEEQATATHSDAEQAQIVDDMAPLTAVGQPASPAVDRGKLKRQEPKPPQSPQTALPEQSEKAAVPTERTETPPRQSAAQLATFSGRGATDQIALPRVFSQSRILKEGDGGPVPMRRNAVRAGAMPVRPEMARQPTPVANGMPLDIQHALPAPARPSVQVGEGAPRASHPLEARLGPQTPRAIPVPGVIAAARPPDFVTKMGRTFETVDAVDRLFATSAAGEAQRVEFVSSRSAPVGVGGATSEVARLVANQIAIAVSPLRAGTTEVTLSPRELGHVRLILNTKDTVVSVVVTVERPDTGDLLRRHIDILGQEFRTLGYDEIAFSFSDQQAPENGSKSDTGDTGRALPDADIEQAENARLLVESRVDGLDLRL